MTVILNRQDSTVNLSVSDDGLTAQPLLSDALCKLCSGVRANASALHGKLFFIVEVLEELQEDDGTHEVLIGLSTRVSDVAQLGTGSSYAISSTAEKWTAAKAEAFGIKFGVGDKVGCFLDLDSHTCTVNFAINSNWLGAAYEVVRPVRPQTALFPHILLKNVKVKVDFTSQIAEGDTDWPAEATSYQPWAVRTPCTSSACMRHYLWFCCCQVYCCVNVAPKHSCIYFRLV